MNQIFTHLLRGGKLFLTLLLLQAFVPRMPVYFAFNGPSWSLSCEQLFYILCPVLLPRLRDLKRTGWIVLGLLAAVATGMYFSPIERYNDFWYVNPLLRLPEFLVGVLLFGIFRKSRARKGRWAYSLLELLSIGLFVAFYCFAENVPMSYRCSVYYTFPIAFLLFVFARQRGVVSRILSRRLFVWLGEISYGFYLIHLIVIRLFGWAVDSWEVRIDGFFGLLLVLSVSVVLSAVSYRWFEKPANRWIKQRFA